METVSVTV
jgi:chemosensory pili system protein ChpA (sensor histidine kinase/response regulator)